MPECRVTVVVPTLAADQMLVDCVHSLEEQTLQDFNLVVVDNSERGQVRKSDVVRSRAVIIENAKNIGFGAAINAGYRERPAAFLAVLNDDATAHYGWLENLVEALYEHPQAGMCASRVELRGRNALDSAGMLIASDGASKQRGHERPLSEFLQFGGTLFPSGSAAMYRREMLDEVGGYDEQFFLYCEDTDLGLRGQRAGWECLYVPEARIVHQYSHSAGRASALKAYYVERNRLQVVMKNFPWSMVPRAFVASLTRYWWHLVFSMQGKGAAAQYQQKAGQSSLHLAYFVLRAHVSLLSRLGHIMRCRRQIARTARLSESEFRDLLERHAISLKEVAAL